MDELKTLEQSLEVKNKGAIEGFFEDHFYTLLCGCSLIGVGIILLSDNRSTQMMNVLTAYDMGCKKGSE